MIDFLTFSGASNTKKRFITFRNLNTGRNSQLAEFIITALIFTQCLKNSDHIVLTVIQKFAPVFL